MRSLWDLREESCAVQWEDHLFVWGTLAVKALVEIIFGSIGVGLCIWILTLRKFNAELDWICFRIYFDCILVVDDGFCRMDSQIFILAGWGLHQRVNNKQAGENLQFNEMSPLGDSSRLWSWIVWLSRSQLYNTEANRLLEPPCREFWYPKQMRMPTHRHKYLHIYIYLPTCTPTNLPYENRRVLRTPPSLCLSKGGAASHWKWTAEWRL